MKEIEKARFEKCFGDREAREQREKERREERRGVTNVNVKYVGREMGLFAG